MKRRTSWTPINVVGLQEHSDIAASTRPFRFVPLTDMIHDTDSDEAPPFQPFVGRRKEPEIIYRGHSAEEVQAARNEGFKEGLQAGELKGMEEGKGERFTIDNELSRSLMQIEVQLSTLFHEYRAFCGKAVEDTYKLAYAIAQKVAGEALTENSEAAIRGMVEQCFGFITSEPEVSIRVHPSHVEALKDYLAQRSKLEPFAGQVEVVGEATMSETDCRIEWRDGGATLDISERWAQVEKALAAFLPPSPATDIAAAEETK